MRKEAAQFYLPWKKGRESRQRSWRKKKAVFSGAERFVRTAERAAAETAAKTGIKVSGHQQGTDERDCFYEEDRLPEEMAETIVGGRRIETGMNINLR